MIHKMATEKNKNPERFKTRVPVKTPLTEINEYLSCPLCFGYLIDATAIVECQHTFCKSCILKCLDESESNGKPCFCPICEVQLNEARPHLSLRSDDNLQKLVYKLVPGLIASEIIRRKEFVIKTSNGGKKSPNRREAEDEEEDSQTQLTPILIQEVQKPWTDLIDLVVKDSEELGSFLSPDDAVSLSLEYFKSDEESHKKIGDSAATAAEEKKTKKEQDSKSAATATTPTTCDNKDKANDRRYLQCPAAVSVGLLKKFIRMKYGLSDDYRVDLLYNGDRDNNLENDLTLLDLSFIYKWKKAEPMCFHYRIFDRPVKSITSKPGIKRSASSILDKQPPPDDDTPSSGPPNRSAQSMTSPSSKHPKVGSGSGASGNSSGATTTTSSTPGKVQSMNSTPTISITPSVMPARGKSPSSTPKTTITLRQRKDPKTEEDEKAKQIQPPESPTIKSSDDSKDKSVSPLQMSISTTSCSSSSEGPSSPLKISIRTDEKHHHRHRHRHKEKHKHKSKSKSKDRDKERSKDKDKDKARYKYNAHPNPTMSQTISIKPGKHHHHHHHKHRHHSSGSSTGKNETNNIPSSGGISLSSTASNSNPKIHITSNNVGLNNSVESKGNNTPKSNLQQHQQLRPNSSGIPERRASSSGIQLKPIPVPIPTSSQKSTTLTPIQVNNTNKSSSSSSSTKIIGNVQLQVPKSVTLIPVPPGTQPNKKLLSSSSSEKSCNNNRINTTTFTHPITNKSLNQITVTEVPAPSSSKTNLPTSNNNHVTIEKCTPGQTSHSHLSIPKQFNGPGSMEITKIYCDKGSSNSGGIVKNVFDAQGRKLKGLDISITPSTIKQSNSRKSVEEINRCNSPSSSSANNSFSSKINLAGLPKIPGVSILPQTMHKQAEQQKKLNNNNCTITGIMGLSCTKINDATSNGSNQVNNKNRHQQLQLQHKPTVTVSGQESILRSSSPADSINGKSSTTTNKTPPRKLQIGAEHSSMRIPSPPKNEIKQIVSETKSSSHHNTKKTQKRPFENAFPGKVEKRRESGTLQLNHTAQGPPESKREKLSSGAEIPLDLSGKSSRSTPSPNANKSPTPPLTVKSNIPSPKAKGSNATASQTQTILSIADTLAQKQQNQKQQQQQQHQVQQRTSSRSTSSSSNHSGSSLSPPIIPISNPSPPGANPFNPLGNLLTLSNAAARVRKMGPHHPLHGSPLGNLAAAATAAAYNCSPPGAMGPPATSPPISPGNPQLGLSPAFLQHLSNQQHHLNAMSQLMNAQNMKSPLDHLGVGTAALYNNLAAAAAAARMNGSMSYATPSTQPTNPLSPPYYPGNRPNPSSSLKIPNVPPSTKSNVKIPSPSSNTSSFSVGKSPSLSSSSKSNHHPQQNHNHKPNPPKTTNSNISSSSPHSKPQQQQVPASHSSSSKNGIPSSMSISNFLPKNSSSNPNSNAKITSSMSEFMNSNNLSINNSSSSSALGNLLDSMKVNHKSTTKHGTQEKINKDATSEREQLCKGNTTPKSSPLHHSLPICKLLGTTTESSIVTAPTKPISGGKLGDLGIALGLVPRDPPVLSLNPSLDPKMNMTATPTSMSSSLLNIPAPHHPQNQSVRQIPNPSLLRRRDSTGSEKVPIKIEPQEPQSIELNMKLWIDRYENMKGISGSNCSGNINKPLFSVSVKELNQMDGEESDFKVIKEEVEAPGEPEVTPSGVTTSTKAKEEAEEELNIEESQSKGQEHQGENYEDKQVLPLAFPNNKILPPMENLDSEDCEKSCKTFENVEEEVDNNIKETEEEENIENKNHEKIEVDDDNVGEDNTLVGIKEETMMMTSSSFENNNEEEEQSQKMDVDEHEVEEEEKPFIDFQMSSELTVCPPVDKETEEDNNMNVKLNSSETTVEEFPVQESKMEIVDEEEEGSSSVEREESEDERDETDFDPVMPSESNENMLTIDEDLEDDEESMDQGNDDDMVVGTEEHGNQSDFHPLLIDEDSGDDDSRALMITEEEEDDEDENEQEAENEFERGVLEKQEGDNSNNHSTGEKEEEETENVIDEFNSSQKESELELLEEDEDSSSNLMKETQKDQLNPTNEFSTEEGDTDDDEDGDDEIKNSVFPELINKKDLSQNEEVTEGFPISTTSSSRSPLPEGTTKQLADPPSSSPNVPSLQRVEVGKGPSSPTVIGLSIVPNPTENEKDEEKNFTTNHNSVGNHNKINESEKNDSKANSEEREIQNLVTGLVAVTDGKLCSNNNNNITESCDSGSEHGDSKSTNSESNVTVSTPSPPITTV